MEAFTWLLPLRFFEAGWTIIIWEDKKIINFQKLEQNQQNGRTGLGHDTEAWLWELTPSCESGVVCTVVPSGQDSLPPLSPGLLGTLFKLNFAWCVSQVHCYRSHHHHRHHSLHFTREETEARGAITQGWTAGKLLSHYWSPGWVMCEPDFDAGIPLNHSFTLFFGTGSFTEPRAHQVGLTGWPASSRDPFVWIHLSSGGVIGRPASQHLAFFVGAWDTDSGPHACPRPLLAEPSSLHCLCA